MSVTIDSNKAVLDTQLAIGTFTDCLAMPDVSGAFDHYRYCVAKGRQILLGYLSDSVPEGIVTISTSAPEGSVNHVFVSKDVSHHRSVYTWEALRAYLQEGGLIGSVHTPGIKIWYVHSGRNTRREADEIFVLR